MGIVTLLSDLGLQDASVASVKGILAQYVPGASIVDISHTLEPFYLQQAAYLLASCYKNFPSGTCHMVFFDIYYGNQPTLILHETEGHYFLAPDNGILPLVFGKGINNAWECFTLKTPATFKDWITEAGKIAAGLQDKAPAELNIPGYEITNTPQPILPKIDGNTIECNIIHIDRYENVVLNITREQFEKLGRHRPFRIQFMRDDALTDISQYYNDVREGEKLCRFNSAGYLEIAINRGNAASLLGLKLNREHHVMYNTIKIFFE